MFFNGIVSGLIWATLGPLARLLIQLGYATSYGLVLLLTRGRVQVEDEPFKTWVWRRTSQGVVLGGYLSAAIGTVLWLVFLFAAAVFIDAS